MIVNKDKNKDTDQNQSFSDEWGSIDTISYNEKTGKPIQQPKSTDENQY